MLDRCAASKNLSESKPTDGSFYPDKVGDEGFDLDTVSEELSHGGPTAELEREGPDDGRVCAFGVGCVREEPAPPEGDDQGEGEVQRRAGLCEGILPSTQSRRQVP